MGGPTGVIGASGEPVAVGRVLVVEDDQDIAEAVERLLRSWGADVAVARTAAEAKARLSEGPVPDLILVDVRLPDDSALAVLAEAALLSPAPIAIATSGVARPDEAFRLAQVGVRVYLPKPFGSADLEEAIRRAMSESPALEPAIAAQVGRVGMKVVQRQVRDVMVKEALARAEGSRSGAARLLQVTRQAVQQMVRGEGLAAGDPARDAEPEGPQPQERHV